MSTHAKRQAISSIALVVTLAMLGAGAVQACPVLAGFSQASAAVAAAGHEHSVLVDSVHSPAGTACKHRGAAVPERDRDGQWDGPALFIAPTDRHMESLARASDSRDPRLDAVRTSVAVPPIYILHCAFLK